VYRQDSFGRDIIQGYGSMIVPTVPGRYTRYIRMFAPVSSSTLQSWLVWLTGNKPEVRAVLHFFCFVLFVLCCLGRWLLLSSSSLCFFSLSACLLVSVCVCVCVFFYLFLFSSVCVLGWGRQCELS